MSAKDSHTAGPAGVHVVAAAVIDLQGRVLIAQRPAGKHLAGGWEFPGGKLEAGEDRGVGLARELREELGITISTPRPLIRVRHAYDYGDVLIDMWVVRNYSGEPSGLDGQALRWVSQEELEAVELLPADGPIVAALRLPERLTQVSTAYYAVGEIGGPDAGGRLRGVLCAGMADAMAGSDAGADFLVLRNELSHTEITSLCELVPVPVYVRGLVLGKAWEMGATGINEIGD
ncbi:MAG: (deoxy)nucleoside triphosphate pyrophosphohydrolase [Pseudomonadota bacterium]|nr:(deoxy)nucleoside triphosphate pyrophosphohydrolase [Pseudomonadota bacterium]